MQFQSHRPPFKSPRATCGYWRANWTEQMYFHPRWKFCLMGLLYTKHFSFVLQFKNWPHSWLKLRLFFTDKEINLARHFFYVYKKVCVCVWSFLPFTFSFWHKFEFPFSLGPPKGLSLLSLCILPRCVLWKDRYSGQAMATAWGPVNFLALQRIQFSF